MGYKNRIVRLTFDELVDDGDTCWIDMLNPALQPTEKLTPKDIEVDADGVPKDFREAEMATYEMFAGLIVGWRVWDGTDASSEPQTLALPATADLVAKLPIEIVKAIGDKISEALPNSSTP